MKVIHEFNPDHDDPSLQELREILDRCEATTPEHLRETIRFRFEQAGDQYDGYSRAEVIIVRDYTETEHEEIRQRHEKYKQRLLEQDRQQYLRLKAQFER